MFFQRQSGEMITFVRNLDDSTKVIGVIALGDSVELRVEDEIVEVLIDSIIGPKAYRGTIINFIPSDATLFGNLTRGQSIDFLEINVFTCSSS